LGFKREELKSRETQADLDRNLRMKLVEAQLKPTDMQRALEILNTGTEAEKENLKAYLALKKAADANPLGLPDPAGGGGAGAPTVLDDM
jgi:hypothetical protein